MRVSPIQKQRNKYHFLKINKTFKTLNFKTKLSLLQEIFQTQEWNQGLLHCMQILYQLSFVGSPKVKVKVTQSCLTLCNPWTGVLQARILEWVAFSLFQRIFPTQELNWGLLHCRQILYLEIGLLDIGNADLKAEEKRGFVSLFPSVYIHLYSAF